MELRDYQKEAADKLYWLLARKQFAYLMGEVRTGKTLTALSLIERLGIQRCLLVTKKKAIPSIEKDAKALGLQDKVLIINYERLPKFAWTFWQLLIVDEAHNFISRIVNKIRPLSEEKLFKERNKLQIKDDNENMNISLKMYFQLLSAVNCKIVLLTGFSVKKSPSLPTNIT